MSHHQYNHYASGKPASTQRQYEHSVQSERDHNWGSSLGPASSYGSSGSSSARVEQSDRGIPLFLSQTRSYRPEQSTTAMNDIDERSVDMHRRAKEEVKAFSKHQPIDQGAHFTSVQREDYRSTDTGMMSYPQSSSSASIQPRRSDVDSDGSSWGSGYRRSTSDNSEFYSSTAFKYTNTCDSRHNVRGERQGEMHSGASSKDYDYNIREKSSASNPESPIPKYTPQSAADILLYFGLEKEDLEELKSYPEDQLTPANLPFILRQIRIKKGKTPTAGGPKTPHLDLGATSGSGLDSHSLSTSIATEVSRKGTSSSRLQQSKVIDYGHVSRYTGSIMDDVAKTSDGGSVSLMDPYSHSRNQQEPLQKERTSMNSASLSASHNQETLITGQSSSHRSVLNSAVPQMLQVHPSQDGFSPYSLTKDTDIGIVKSEASKPAPLKEPEASRQLTKTIGTTFKSTSKGHARSTSVTGVVLFDSKNKDAKTRKKTQVQVPTGLEQFKKQQAQRKLQQQPQEQTQPRQQVQRKPQQQPQEQTQPRQQVQEQTQPRQQVQEQTQPRQQVQRKPQQQPQQPAQRKPVDQQPKQQLTLLMPQQPKEQQPNQPAFQPGQATWLPGFSARSASHNPGVGASPALGNLVFVPHGRPPVNIPTQVMPQLMNLGPPKFTTATDRSSAALPSAHLPTPAMMYDYAATSPKIFPHTCSLCNTECTRMKVSERLHSCHTTFCSTIYVFSHSQHSVLIGLCCSSLLKI